MGLAHLRKRHEHDERVRLTRDITKNDVERKPWSQHFDSSLREACTARVVHFGNSSAISFKICLAPFKVSRTLGFRKQEAVKGAKQLLERFSQKVSENGHWWRIRIRRSSCLARYRVPHERGS